MTQLKRLPIDIQRDYRAQLQPGQPTDKGIFRLVNIRRTQPGTFEERRIIVLVIDEDGHPIPGEMVAFSFSTANEYFLSDDFQWTPPPPRKAFIVPTQGSGQIDQIQGGAIKPGEPGGVTVYLLTPEFSSDVVVGCGMLGDHSGLHLTFQLERVGVVPLADRLAAIEARLTNLEDKIG